MGKSESKTTIQKNVQKLLDAGVSQEFINAELKKGKGGLAKGTKINTWDVPKFLKAWEAQAGSRKFQKRVAALPDEIKNDPAFKSLTNDQKEIVVYNYEIQLEDNKVKQKALADALEMATEQADPYWKNIIRIAQDEVTRNLEGAQGDYDFQLEQQERRIQEIQQDLAANKEFLSLEQQNELARLAQNYQIDYENTLENASQAGLTFSTKRRLALQRLKTSQEGMVESTNRQYGKQIRDLQESAASGSVEAQKQIEDLQRRIKESTTSIGRSAETYLGSERTSALPGYQPLGGVTGTIEEEKIKDIELRKNALFSELTAESLNT